MAPRETRRLDHAWRAGRGLPALATDSFRVDERTEADLLAGAVAFARLLTFFDRDNQAHPPPSHEDAATVRGWETFFDDDVSFLLAQMCMVDAGREFRASLAVAGSDLEDLIATALERLVLWYQRAESLTGSTVAQNIEAALLATLHSAIKSELSKLLSESLVKRLRPRGPALPKVWELGTAEYRRDAIYSALNRVTAQIVDVARQYLAASLHEKADHQPHTGLFLSFVSLFQKSQAHLNQLTERHLAFYYNKVLRLARAEATPDRAHLAFRLSPQIPRLELPAGTGLSADSDSLIYRTDHELVVGHARVVAFKAINVRRDRSIGGGEDGVPPAVRAIRAYPVADSADGFGAKLADPSRGWRSFGATRGAPAVRSHADIGIAIQAPVLRLREGERRIDLVLRVAPGRTNSVAQARTRYRRQVQDDYEGTLSDGAFQRLLCGMFLVSVSTESGFRPVHDVEVDLRDAADEIAFHFRLGATEPPLEPLAADVTALGASALPTVKLLLNPAARSYGYAALRGLVIQGARIDVEVRGLRTLNLQTAQGPVDAGKPFPPFGVAPEPGAYLLFANPELWGKHLTRLWLRLEWRNLPRPAADLAKLYADYGLDTRNDSFRGVFAARVNFRWQSLTVRGSEEGDAGVALFPPLPGDEGLASAVGWELDLEGLAPLDGPPLAGADPLLFAPTTASGFFRLELTDPPYGFGHALYPQILADAAIANAKPVPIRLRKAPPPKPLPAAPLTPLAANAAVDYDAAAVIGSGADPDQGVLRHLHPFGQLAAARDGGLLVGDYDHDGYLYLGIRDLRPPQTLTLLFHVHESAAEQWSPGQGFARPQQRWLYLADNRWLPLPRELILADETHGLITSGIVKLALPADTSDRNTILDDGLFWLAIAIDGDSDRFGRMVGVHTQAVTATRVLQEEAQDETPPFARPGAITKFVEPTPQIVAIEQPFAASAGRAAETENAFRIRVSERLRHKQRAIQAGDYERLVLEAFPEIHEARCIQHRPGQVVLVVTPVRTELPVVDRPRVSLHLRLAISRWLHRHASPWAERITVRDPSYEWVKIVAHVAPSRAADASFVRQIEQALAAFIAPWRFDPAAPMAIGTGALDLEAVHALMEDLACVARVQGLSIVHTFRTVSGAAQSARYGIKDTARVAGGGVALRPATPWSVLVPAAPHGISILGRRRGIGDLRVNTDLTVANPRDLAVFHSDDTRIPMRPAPAGIGNLAIGRDLIVALPADVRPPNSRIGGGGAEETKASPP